VPRFTTERAHQLIVNSRHLTHALELPSSLAVA
jgi:hypothetical protein